MVPIDQLIPYIRNSRTHTGEQVALVAASIREFGWTNPILIRPDYVVIAGHARLLAARKLGLTEVPAIELSGLTESQCRALAIADNQLAITGAGWDEEMLRIELAALQEEDFNVNLIGFEDDELARLLADTDAGSLTDEDVVPDPPVDPVTKTGDLWLLGPHRVLCGNALSGEDVIRVCGTPESRRQPFLMVTDPPYGIELDSEWRDRAGLNGCGPAEASYMKHRTEGHSETKISGDTRADWSQAYELLPNLQIAYVWHASKFTREVLDGLLRIGFLHHQQIIWNKGRTVLTRTHYWFQHEPCWYVRKKNAPWYGKPGENSTIWDSPSPKFIMGGSDEQKYDHPTPNFLSCLPTSEARRVDEAPDSEPHQTRRGGLRRLSRKRNDFGGRGIHGACLLRPRDRPQVRRRHRHALAKLHGKEGDAGGRWAQLRRGR